MLRTTRSNEDAEDIAQESFARLWKMRDRIDPDGNIQALIFVIARRAAVDHYRRSERSGSIFNSEKTATELPLDSSPEDILEATETRLLLQLAIENMPRKQREVFALHYYDNLTPAEIAARLGLSYENARKQIWRAKQQLREVVTMMGILLLIET
jgi:RNA polymerase sigma-70 factor (ECF subfamily)